MSYQKLLDFSKNEGIVLLENEPLSKHTSFRIGGPACLFALPETVGQLTALVAFASENKLKWTVIGNGSNLLALDAGFDGLVIRTPEEPPRWSEEGTTVTVASG
jgi:UDP-N-acetylmuramate dehydrogenase